jgi:hypothetical protein
VRVVAAGLLALVLVPRFGAAGGAAGFLASELLLLVLSARACRMAGLPVPLARPLALGLALAAPMAAAVLLVRGGAIASVLVGVATYALTLAAVWRIQPELLQGQDHGGRS